MQKKGILIALGAIFSVVVISSAFAVMHGKISQQVSTSEKEKHAHEDKDHEDTKNSSEHEEKMLITLTPQQIIKYDIKTLKITLSSFQKKLSIPGEIILNENKLTHVVATIPGVVKDIYKNLGESVVKGESLASLQSREMADTKAGYLAAYRDVGLKADLFKREEKLWNLNLKAEIEFLKTKNILEAAKIQLEQAKQKLLALGITESEIAALPQEKGAFNLYTIESPIDGVIIERHLTRGEVIDKDKQIYVLADLKTVWVNLAITAKDLHKVRAGQMVTITSSQESTASSQIMYVSPVINEESRNGRAIVELDNSKNEWHPGDFITAEITIPEKEENLIIPREAVQKINGIPVIFLNTSEGFEAKQVTVQDLNRSDMIHIKEGLNAGDEIAISNTFLLKAELGKSEAEHAH